MKAWLCMLLLWAGLTGPAHTQTHFNLRKPLNSFASVTTSVIEHNGKFYAIGVTIDSSNYIGGGFFNNVLGIRFTAFSQNGDVLLNTVYQLPPTVVGNTAGRQLGAWRVPVQLTAEGNFLIVAESYDSANTMSNAIIILDSTGSPLLFKEISRPLVCPLPVGNTNGVFFQTRSFQRDGNGDWLMFSAITCDLPSPASWRGNMLLTKLDSAFNIKWHRLYATPSPWWDESKRMIIEEDGYLLLSLKYKDEGFFTQNTRGATVITKVDTAGNQIWRWESSDTALENGCDLIRTADSGYLWCGAGDKKVEDNGVGYYFLYGRGLIQKLDSLRQPQWKHIVSSIRSSDYIGTVQRVIRQLPNGDVVIAGDAAYCRTEPCVRDSAAAHGSLTRLDPITSQIRWQRRYVSPSPFYAFRAINDMQPTADGGFILVGEARDYTDPTQQSWILKVDSNGCLGPNDPQCLPTSIATAPPSGNAEYLVYPNPTTGQLILYYEHASQTGDEPASFQLTDLAGRIVTAFALKNAFGQQMIDMSHLPTGLYLWRVSHAGGVIARGKVVKQ